MAYSRPSLLGGVVYHGQLLAGVVDHGQLLELLLAKLGLYTELLLAGLGFTKREYARTCCWLGSVLLLEVGVVRHNLLLVRLGMYTTRLGDHGQLLAGVVDHELLLARLGMYTTCCRPRRNDRKKEK